MSNFFKYIFLLLFAVVCIAPKIQAQCDALDYTYIDSVSVHPETGDIYIAWFQNSSPHTESYEVLMHNPAMSPVWNAISGTSGAGNVSVIISGLNTNARSYILNVSAKDTCGEKSPFPPGHNTIFVENEYNSCALEVKLTWNQYRNWQTGIKNYEVWVKENGVHTMIGTTPAGDTTFTHTGATPLANLDYYVRAVDNSTPRKSSTSNYSPVYTYFPDIPDYSYARFASVEGESIVISGFFDASAEVEKYLIQRQSENIFETIEEILPASLTGNNLTYTDMNADPGKQSYTYRVVTVNTCGREINTSNIAKTIHLEVQNMEGDFKNLLGWNSYEGWSGAVEAYTIYRSVNGVFSLIATVAPNVNQFSDDIYNLNSSTGEFCYYIEAVEGSGNPHSFKEKSRSNRVCVEQKPIVYIANAFTPNGKNPVWKPVFSYLPPDNYRLMVFNRWGEKIFETQDPQMGWDGNGGSAQAGVYVYRMEFTSLGEILTRSGTVTIIK